MKNFAKLKSCLMWVCFLTLGANALAQSQSINTVDISRGDGKRYSYVYSAGEGQHANNPCRIFIGVYTDQSENGLRVSGTIKDTPAKIYGVQEGDVIVSIDNVKVSTQTELIRQRDTHTQGDAFTLEILRNGQPMTINAKFKSCSQEELEKAREAENAKMVTLNELDARLEEMKSRLSEMDAYRQHLGNMNYVDRPILGIYPDESADVKGVRVDDIINGKGAAKAGLRSGDVITIVDGKDLTNGLSIKSALNGRKAGETVKVIFIRDGERLEGDVLLSKGESAFTYRVERDPCAVFIGVYTSGRGDGGNGVRVVGIIDNTPAKSSDVRAGDIILALDGVAVNTYNELGFERDKHKPGDKFRLTVLRDGTTMEIEAQFKNCADKTEKPKEETVTLLTEEKQDVQVRNEPTSTQQLQLEVFKAFPNPTFGPLSVRFEAEAIPTTVRVFDMNGKEVIKQVLNNFGGLYNEELNLSGKTPGNYILSIEQGGKTFAKTIVLMPRV